MRKQGHNCKSAKSYEQRVDRLVKSTPFFRGAGRRCIGELSDITIDKIERTIESMAKFAKAQGKKKAEREIHKILANFRKKRRKPIYKPIHSV
jgi:hypothetical protein